MYNAKYWMLNYVYLSWQIFCAKCGSKDFSANNDIVLCDGGCDRGFHQMCLVPPLLNSNIQKHSADGFLKS